MFGVSGTELFIIVVFALLVFGPDKLPQFGRTAGRMIREFQRAQDTMESMIRTEMYGEKGNSDSAVPVDPAVKAREIPADEDEEEEEED